MATSTNAPSLSNDMSLSPDFYIFTAGMVIDETAGLERPIVRMVGSSTEQDLHKDTMTISALQDMAAAPPGLLIWLNHDYTVPDSLFGSLTEQPILISKGGFTDLHIAVEVELDNPAAAKTYRYIQKHRRLGCSVGCSVEDYKLVDGPNSDSPLVHITQVRPVEWSVVGIPANQRSWVENAARGLFQKELSRPTPSGDIERLASIVKSLFPTEFNRMIEGTPYMALKSVKARPMTNKRILWEPESKKFFLATGSNERAEWREIPRTDGALESARKSVFGGETVNAPTGFIPTGTANVTQQPMPSVTVTGTYVSPTTVLTDGGQWQWFPGAQASASTVPGQVWQFSTASASAPDPVEQAAQSYLAGREYSALSDAEKDALAQHVAHALTKANGE